MSTKKKNSDAYLDLLEEISSVFDGARGRSQAESNKEMLVAYWEIGQQIIEVEQDSQSQAKYGARIIERLSSDLNGRFGSGFSKRNLFYMRSFFEEYPIVHARAQLSWTQYRSLLSVKDRTVRDELEKLAIEQKWSSKSLQEKVREHNKANNNSTLAVLTEPVGRLFVYEIIKPSRALEHMVDLGFGVHHQPDVADASNLRSGTFIKSEKLKTKYRLITIEAPRGRKERFAYVAYLIKVVDGDTLVVKVDLGFNVFVEQRLRLRGIDAPEIDSPTGQQAKTFVEDRLNRSGKIVIKTYSIDRYGRRIADVMHLRGEKNPQVILEKGYFLNQELLDVGLVDSVN